MSLKRRREMIDQKHQRLSIRRQCRILHMGRSSYYYSPVGETPFNLELMRKIDELFMECPFYGSRQMRDSLRDLDYEVGRKRVQRLMRKMGLMAIYRKPRTSRPHTEHQVYPYLLRNLKVDRPNQVWCADITYLPLRRGYMYLVAVMDWHTRAVLSWRLSNTMEADYCVDALNEALSRYGVPEIFNTDQGSQFTSREFTQAVKDAGARVSMDGRGRWLDNVMIERLWRSLKYECVYLREAETVSQLRGSLSWWFDLYNYRRPHSSLDGEKPMAVYQKGLKPEGAPPLACPKKAA